MILHVDMDAFYASVEELDQPELVGRPVIVGGTPQGRGVVAAANYVAREFGVHSAMPAATAKRLCPQAVFLPSRIDRYAAVSRDMQDIFDRFTPLVEPLSLDEAFLDVTGSEQLFGTALEIGRQIQSAIGSELGLTASVGVAPNKFLAKIASDLEKPAGFVVVEPERIREFLDPLPIERMWGVGRQGSKVFHELNIRTIGQLESLPREVLQARFGNSGEHFWRLARGIDKRPVVPDRRAKSISHETTFEKDIQDSELLRACLLELTEQVARRLRRHGLYGRTVTLKVRFDDFRTITRSQTLGHRTNSTLDLWNAAAELLATRVPAGQKRVRLLGMGVSGLDRRDETQRQLFDDVEREKAKRLDETADEVRDRFGGGALRRGSTMRKGGAEEPS